MNLKSLISKYRSDPNYTFKDIIDFFIAEYRYFLYYYKNDKGEYSLRFLLQNHIIEQYEMDIAYMNKECYNNGNCIKCGCMTTALQFCNKACKGSCYTPKVNKRLWEDFKKMKKGIFDKKNNIYWALTYSSEYPHQKILKSIPNYIK